MASYEDAVSETDKLQLELERFGIDDYTIEVVDESLLPYITATITALGGLYSASSSKVKVVKASELSRATGNKQRFSLLLNVEVPRAPLSTTILQGRRKVPGGNDSQNSGGTPDSPSTASQKGRKTRLTET